MFSYLRGSKQHKYEPNWTCKNRGMYVFLGSIGGSNCYGPRKHIITQLRGVLQHFILAQKKKMPSVTRWLNKSAVEKASSYE